MRKRKTHHRRSGTSGLVSQPNRYVCNCKYRNILVVCFPGQTHVLVRFVQHSEREPAWFSVRRADSTKQRPFLGLGLGLGYPQDPTKQSRSNTQQQQQLRYYECYHGAPYLYGVSVRMCILMRKENGTLWSSVLRIYNTTKYVPWFQNEKQQSDIYLAG